MASPRVSADAKLKRVIRYLKAHPMGTQLFAWQETTEEITLFTERLGDVQSDQAILLGGAILHGRHLLSHWCRMQWEISLSSGKAELYSGNRGLSELAGILILYREMKGADWGCVRHCVDASASRSFFLRKGSGSMKHIETKDMWGQAFVRKYKVIVNKVSRDVNLADALASPCSPQDLATHLRAMDFYADPNKLGAWQEVAYFFCSSRWHRRRVLSPTCMWQVTVATACLRQTDRTGLQGHSVVDGVVLRRATKRPIRGDNCASDRGGVLEHMSLPPSQRPAH